jgi:hypothetical protein
VDALNVLDLCRKGVPFNAIEHLQNDTAEETTSAILKALKNYSDHQYCWGDCTNAPFWYALAAEGHICEALIEPLIQLYRANENKSEWLNMQGQYLTGKLAQKYPDQTAQKVLKAMENEVVEKSDFYLPYLFDAFYFCDLEKYKSRLVAFLEGDDFYWYDPLAITIAYLQIQEALPVLKRKLEMLKTKPAKTPWQMASIVEIKEAIQILEGELPKEELESLKPYCLTREGTWKDELKEEEASFYEDVDFEDPYDFQNFLDRKTDSFPSWSPFSTKEPYIKEKTPERNDPCPCGSGKKYKKCCMG